MTGERYSKVMGRDRFPPSLAIFSTSPPSSTSDRQVYRQSVIEVARWSEHYGCEGMLVYTDNSLIDPWLVAQLIIEHTEALCPLVAVQAAYLHPYAVAKMVASFAYLYNRRVYLNMVAGGFKHDLVALNDTTPHDKRYDRLREYTLIIQQLVAGGLPFTYDGEFYKVNKLKLIPPLPQALCPGIFVSGSSEAGMATARAIGATAVQYPKPAREYEGDAANRAAAVGLRVGIIAREDEDEAWATARARFPEDRKGQITHHLAMKTSDSEWHAQLSKMAEKPDNGPYWLVPFENYKTFCPYLVGSYQRVGAELSGYVAAGYRTFIQDVPANEEELRHTMIAFKLALAGTT